MSFFDKIKSWFSPITVPAKDEFESLPVEVNVKEPVVAPAEPKAVPEKKAVKKSTKKVEEKIVTEKKTRKPKAK